jgi:hypothetical protein
VSARCDGKAEGNTFHVYVQHAECHPAFLSLCCMYTLRRRPQAACLRCVMVKQKAAHVALCIAGGQWWTLLGQQRTLKQQQHCGSRAALMLAFSSACLSSRPPPRPGGPCQPRQGLMTVCVCTGSAACCRCAAAAAAATALWQQSCHDAGIQHHLPQQ